MNYSIVLNYLYPERAWTVLGNSYDGIDWQDDTPKPSDAVLKAAWAEASYSLECDKVSAARQAAYSSLNGSDSVFFKYQRGEATEKEWLDAVQAINDANPYPEEIA